VRLFGRHDLLLAAGLATALIVVFSEPVARLLQSVQAIEKALGLQLVPALVILASVYAFHQVWNRQELRSKTLVSEVAAREATARANDMSRLVAFGDALARSLDADSIRAAAAAHLPLLVPGRGIWAMLRVDGGWQPLIAVGDASPEQRQADAAAVLDVNTTGAMRGSDVCFPMVAADTPLGVVGVSPEPPLTAHQQNMLATAAALLAVAFKNAGLFQQIRDNSVRDALTGCVNRAHMLEVFAAELSRARRSQAPISIVMFDLDHFKAINDRYGHLCGDAVLASIGARMRELLRSGDVKCRYGGEEFLILLFDTPSPGAQHVAETLRRQLELHPVPWQEQVVRVTASFGVTAARPGESDPLAILRRADEALYRAKQSGRNRVTVADPDGRHVTVPPLRLASRST
jgi:diguanylate cyclase (GGDEF)-like protein